jgi:hypothetical protein
MTTDSDPTWGNGSSRMRAVARLSALQNLRNQAVANDRRNMLETINKMIDAELRALKHSGSDDTNLQGHPSADGDDKHPSGN